MLKLAVLALAVYCAAAEFYEESYARWAGDHGNWQAGYHQQFAGWSLEQIKSLMGTKMDKRPGVPVKDESVDEASLPASFNCKDKWPQCAGVFNFIKDQAGCGSCWAVSASNVIAGRTCIANGGVKEEAENSVHQITPVLLNEPAPPVDFSSQQIMSCCSWCGDGCQGGYPIDAMRYWCWNGVVTGGWYNSNCGCYPYGIPPCPPSGCTEGPTPKCKKQCRSGYGRSYSNDKHYCTDHYEISSRASAIQTEIMNYGPVECAFTVHDSFMHYTNGVYDSCDGRELGGHAVTNYGWGSMNGVPYWIFHNSWNVTWGMQGKFYIKRGVDLCGIESQCVAGKAKTPDSNYKLVC
jgi:cathepsin B